MQTYRIAAPHFTAGVIVGGDVVLQAAPILSWTVGRYFVEVRDYCKKRGWIIEPLPEPPRPTFFEIDGCVYELTWNEGALVRINLLDGEDVRELTYDELPDILKEQL